tara:strand:- start:559 stop:798 length:240 start_codon:yes stop_codon:yes gene_type:complete
MINKTVLQAIDEVAPDEPMIPIMMVCNVLDRSRTNSLDSVVEEMKRLMMLTDVTPCQLLSAFVRDTLLPDSDDPCHVYY